jgi:hypothetical protein
MVEHWFGTQRRHGDRPVRQPLTRLASDRYKRRPADRRELAGRVRVEPVRINGGKQAVLGTITPGMVDAIFEVCPPCRLAGDLRAQPRRGQPDACRRSRGDVRGVLRHTGQLLGFERGNEPNGYLTTVNAYMERIGRYVAALDASPAHRRGADHGSGDLGECRRCVRRRPLERLFHSHAVRNLASTTQLTESGPSLPDDWRKIDELGERITAMDDAVGVGHLPVWAKATRPPAGGIDGVSIRGRSGCWLIDRPCCPPHSGGRAGWNTHSWDGFYYPAEGRTCWYTPFVVRKRAGLGRPAFLRDGAVQVRVGSAVRRRTDQQRERQLVANVGSAGPVGAHLCVRDQQGRRR